jgi:hypothetical protein
VPALFLVPVPGLGPAHRKVSFEGRNDPDAAGGSGLHSGFSGARIRAWRIMAEIGLVITGNSVRARRLREFCQATEFIHRDVLVEPALSRQHL